MVNLANVVKQESPQVEFPPHPEQYSKYQPKSSCCQYHMFTLRKHQT